MKTIGKLVGSMVCFYLGVYWLTDVTLRLGIAIGEDRTYRRVTKDLQNIIDLAEESSES